MTERRKLNAAEVAELVGITRTDWTSRVSRQQAPRPDGHEGIHPFWWEGTIGDWLVFISSKTANKMPTKAERFETWRARQRKGKEQPEQPVDLDLIEAVHIRRHRTFGDTEEGVGAMG